MSYKPAEQREATRENNLIASARIFYKVAVDAAIVCGKPIGWAWDLTLRQFGKHAHEAMATQASDNDKKSTE